MYGGVLVLALYPSTHRMSSLRLTVALGRLVVMETVRPNGGITGAGERWEAIVVEGRLVSSGAATPTGAVICMSLSLSQSCVRVLMHQGSHCRLIHKGGHCVVARIWRLHVLLVVLLLVATATASAVVVI